MRIITNFALYDIIGNYLFVKRVGRPSRFYCLFALNKILTFPLFYFQELGLSPSVPVHVVLQDWIRHSDGKLSFLGFVRLLHGLSSRAFQKAWYIVQPHILVFRPFLSCTGTRIHIISRQVTCQIKNKLLEEKLPTSW